MFTTLFIFAVIAMSLLLLPWLLIKLIGGVFSLVGSVIGGVFSLICGLFGALASLALFMLVLPLAVLAGVLALALPVLLPLALLAGLIWLVARAARPKPALPALPAPG